MRRRRASDSKRRASIATSETERRSRRRRRRVRCVTVARSLRIERTPKNHTLELNRVNGTYNSYQKRPLIIHTNRKIYHLTTIKPRCPTVKASVANRCKLITRRRERRRRRRRRAEGDAFRRSFTNRERFRIYHPRLASHARDDGGDIHGEMCENDDAR